MAAERNRERAAAPGCWRSSCWWCGRRCGVPEPERADRHGRRRPGSAAPRRPVPPGCPARDGATTPPDLGQRFLQAGAAADWDPAMRQESGSRPRSRRARSSWTRPAPAPGRPATSIDVVEVVNLRRRRSRLGDVDLTPVGELDANGVDRAAVGPEMADLQLQVVPAADNRSRCCSAASPDDLLPLSLDGLATLFEVRPVYFWDQTEQFLVPDRRYMSRGISDEKRVKTIVDRVLAGPSQLPQGRGDAHSAGRTSTRDNAVLNGNTVGSTCHVPEETDHDRRAAAGSPRRSAGRCIRSGLGARCRSAAATRPHLRGGRSTCKANPSQRAGPERQTRRGCSPRCRTAKSMPVSTGGVGAVDPAAGRRTRRRRGRGQPGRTRPALVRQVGGRPDGSCGSADAGRPSAAQFRRYRPGPARPISRPSYLPGAGDRVLIVADGNLYDVDLGTAVATVDPAAVAGGFRDRRVGGAGRRAASRSSRRARCSSRRSTRPSSRDRSTRLRAAVRRGLRAQPRRPARRGLDYEHQIVVGGAVARPMVAAIDGGTLEPTGRPTCRARSSPSCRRCRETRSTDPRQRRRGRGRPRRSSGRRTTRTARAWSRSSTAGRARRRPRRRPARARRPRARVTARSTPT